MFLKTLWFGSFLIKDGEIFDKSLFPKVPQEIAHRSQLMLNGEILEEEREIAEGQNSLIVDDRRLLKLGNTRSIYYSDDDTNEPHSEGGPEGGSDNSLSIRLTKGRQGGGGDIAPIIRPEDYGYSTVLLQESMVILYSKKLAKTMRSREIIELISTLDEIHHTINLLEERDQEWSKVYGQDPHPQILGSFKDRVRELEDFREDLSQTITEYMQRNNPNLSALTGEILGARLIALAGGRERLARFPSGTIQILGAESAFFRYRKSGKGMPKHGIIFQHPMIKTAHKPLRGKIARSLAAKISIAVRIDHYSERDDGDILKSALEERIKMMKKSPSRKKN